MAEIDSDRYEFDAPSHVVDFKELESTQNDDRWFEKQAEGAACPLITPQKPNGFTVSEKPEEIAPCQNPTAGNAGSSMPASPPSNIVTSWGGEKSGKQGARPKRRTVNQLPVQPRRVSKRKTVIDAPSAPPLKKQKEPCTSEEKELERIKVLQEEVALHRKKNEASYKIALAGNPPPKKMILSATVPQDFHFNTDSRVKASSSATSHKVVDFISQLRKPSSPAKARKGATVPKPFNLSRGIRQKADESTAYVPMAQRIEQFQKQTPDRYHVQSRKAHDRGPSSIKQDHLKLTHPHSPQLMTRQRRRTVAIKSCSELEAEELEKLKKHKLKPVKLNKKILISAEPLKKPAAKDFTVPEAFEMEIEKRLQDRQTSKRDREGEEKPYNFRARPVPKEVLEGVIGLPAKKVAQTTVPESPAFALKNRVRVDRKVEEAKPPSPIKALPAPPVRPPLEIRPVENHHIEVCPFSFEQREREKLALKEKRLEEKQNEEVPQFKAQPLPNFKTVVLPEKKKLEPTKPEPFKLLIDERGAMKSSNWEQMVKEEQKHQEDAAIFKARPNTVTHKVPFRPIKDNRPAVGMNSSTAVEPFELATERRAREWQEFEQMACEKEALRLRREAERKWEEEQAEKEEIARLRQEQVHKAQPIRHYKPVAVKKSEVPPTVPESPNFSDRFRC
ncbi:targeting protein for Xklp2 isoform X2 [Gouania willdenowi]|uniref:Uncharacterized protein n=1 Tax=Gouania willdenowi TaxID=441366 RepID=A0A8C5NFE9_GOUWI|nr:targeting protein for Xklp2 isoform X2 [Gouania willdenowi]